MFRSVVGLSLGLMSCTPFGSGRDRQDGGVGSADGGAVDAGSGAMGRGVLGNSWSKSESFHSVVYNQIKITSVS